MRRASDFSRSFAARYDEMNMSEAEVSDIGVHFHSSIEL